MADTWTPIFGWQKPEVGADANIWGGLLNTDFDLIESALAGGAAPGQSISIAGLTTYTLTVAQGAPDQRRNLIYNFTGALAANCVVTIPTAARIGWAIDNTTGSHTVTLTTGGGATLPLVKGTWNLWWCDGTNIVQVPALGGVVTPAVTFDGQTTFNGSAHFVGSPTFPAAVNGNLAVTGNLSGAVISSTGGIVSGILSGWAYAAAGPGFAFTSATVGYGVTATAQNMLALNFYAVSDVRLKFEIETITEADAMQWLQRSRPVTYLKLPSYGVDPAAAIREAGFVAQEQVVAGYGRYVGTAPCEGLPERVDGDLTSLADHMLTLPLSYQVAMLARALQAALARIEALEARP